MDFICLLICLLIGYLLGSLNPAALIGKLKKTDLKAVGTGNLGATNTALIFGKALGAFVMIFDIGKAYAASKIAQLIFPAIRLSGLIAGFGAVVGHMYPFYLKFRGGKGLAAFGGMVLAYEPWLFWAILTSGVVLLLLLNYGVIIAVEAAIIFPVYVAFQGESVWALVIALASSFLLMHKFKINFSKIKSGNEIKSRDFLKRKQSAEDAQ